MRDPVKYLTVDQANEAHSAALEAAGGLDGIRSVHRLAAAVMQPQQSAFGEEAYPTIPEKAAAYGFFLAESQPYVDGNKRTAAMLALMFLRINGYELRQDDDEIAEMFEALGSQTIGQSEFFVWVCTHARSAR